MSDLEITRLCAEAMGFVWSSSSKKYPFTEPIHSSAAWVNGELYDPLHDDAQAMALEDWLIERGYLWQENGLLRYSSLDRSFEYANFSLFDKAARRKAICECVARMASARAPTSPGTRAIQQVANTAQPSQGGS